MDSEVSFVNGHKLTHHHSTSRLNNEWAVPSVGERASEPARVDSLSADLN